MARHTGGMKVAGGYYWNARTWEVEVIPSEGGRLKGDAAARYVKVPFPVLFVIVPLLGALFLMFLPFIGFGLVAYALARKIAGGVSQGATELASTVQPGSFAAGSAYFTGKPEEREGSAEGPKTEEIRKLEREIEERKGER